MSTVLSLKHPLLAQDSSSSQSVEEKFNIVVDGVSEGPNGLSYYSRS